MSTRRYHATYRIGEEHLQNCGMAAKIIDYKKSNDITIRFLDGTIVEHVEYSNFIHGKINNPSLKRKTIKDRTGETRVMNNGLSACIVRYRNATDIDVKFETGQIVTNKTYYSFCKGCIAYDEKEAYARKSKIRKNTRQNKLVNVANEIKNIIANADNKIEKDFRPNDELLLSLYQKYSASEIAFALSRNVSTVKYWISKAKINLEESR